MNARERGRDKSPAWAAGCLVRPRHGRRGASRPSPTTAPLRPPPPSAPLGHRRATRTPPPLRGRPRVSEAAAGRAFMGLAPAAPRPCSAAVALHPLPFPSLPVICERRGELIYAERRSAPRCAAR